MLQQPTSATTDRRSQVLERIRLRRESRALERTRARAAQAQSRRLHQQHLLVERSKRQREGSRQRKVDAQKAAKHRAVGQRIREIVDRAEAASGIRWPECTRLVHKIPGGAEHPVWMRAQEEHQRRCDAEHQRYRQSQDEIQARRDAEAARVAAQRLRDAAEKKRRSDARFRSFVKSKSIVTPALNALADLYDAMWMPKAAAAAGGESAPGSSSPPGLVNLTLEIQRDPAKRRQMSHLRSFTSRAHDERWWQVCTALCDASHSASKTKKKEEEKGRATATEPSTSSSSSSPLTTSTTTTTTTAAATVRDDLEDAFVEWTRCCGRVHRDVALTAETATKLGMIDEEGHPIRTIGMLQYDFDLDNERGKASAHEVLRNKLYLRVCRAAWKRVAQRRPLPHGIAYPAPGSGLKMLQVWAKEDAAAKAQAVKELQGSVRESNESMWKQWAKLKDKLSFSVPSDIADALSGPIPFQYVGNGSRTPHPAVAGGGGGGEGQSAVAEVPDQYQLAGERTSHPKFNSALLALTSGRVRDGQSLVWGIRSNDPTNLYADVEESRALVNRLQRAKRDEERSARFRASAAKKHFNAFVKHTSHVDKAKAILAGGRLSAERARANSSWLAIGRALYAVGPALETPWVEWSLLHRARTSLPGFVSVGKGQKVAESTANLTDHLLPGDKVCFEGSKQTLEIASVSRKGVQFVAPSLRTTRDATLQRIGSCDERECHARWSEMCHPYVVPALSQAHWARIYRARRFIRGESRRAEALRKTAQIEDAKMAEANVHKVLKELRQTVLVDEIVFVDLSTNDTVPVTVPLLDEDGVSKMAQPGIETTIDATLQVHDIINMDDSSAWWDVVAINAETASVKIRRSRRVAALGDGALRFRLKKMARRSGNYDDDDDAAAEDDGGRDGGGSDPVRSAEFRVTRWITIQSAQTKSGCMVYRLPSGKGDNSYGYHEETGDIDDDEEGKPGGEEEGNTENYPGQGNGRPHLPTPCLFEIPFLSSKAGIAQLQAWAQEDGAVVRSLARRKRWSAWKTAHVWLEKEVVAKTESAMNMVRELDQGRADDMSKWLDVGRALHSMVSSGVRFSKSAKEIVERLISMAPQGENTAGLVVVRGAEDSATGHGNADAADDTAADLDKNAPFLLWVAWTGCAQKWQMLEDQGFRTEDLRKMCASQWMRFAEEQSYGEDEENAPAEGLAALGITRVRHNQGPSPGNTGFFLLDTLAEKKERGGENEEEGKEEEAAGAGDAKDPIAAWSLLASAHMGCILEQCEYLRKMLQMDVSARKRREHKRLCPEPVLVSSTATTMEFSWWHADEEWDPIPGCTYQLCMRVIKLAVDDGIGQMDLNGFDVIYSGRDSGCAVRDLVPGTTYQCRLKAVFEPQESQGSLGRKKKKKKKSRLKKGIKWSAPLRATTLAPTPALLCCRKQLSMGRRERAAELTWTIPASSKMNNTSSRRSRFEVEMARGKAKKDWAPVWRGYDLSCTVTGLRRGTWCSFRVRSINCDNMTSPWSDIFDLKVKSAMRVDTGRRRRNNRQAIAAKAAPPPPPAAPVSAAALPCPAPMMRADNTLDGTWREVYDQASGGWFFVNEEGATRRTLPESLVADMVFA